MLDNEAQFYDDMGQLLWEIEENDSDSEARVREDEKCLDEYEAEE